MNTLECALLWWAGDEIAAVGYPNAKRISSLCRARYAKGFQDGRNRAVCIAQWSSQTYVVAIGMEKNNGGGGGGGGGDEGER